MSDITISIKTILFAGDNYYPKGGWDDFQGFYDSVDQALIALNQLCKCRDWQWAHIVHNGNIVKCYSRTWARTKSGYADWVEDSD